MTMEAQDLARWTRFAGKGGIGRCTATCDWVAEEADELMFLKDDEIIVLMQLNEPPGVYLGYCEGVVGRFNGDNVLFHSKLKKPVMAKRVSVQGHPKPPTPTSSFGATSPLPAKEESPVPPPFSSRRPRVSFDEHVAASPALTGLVSPSSISTANEVMIPITDPGVLKLSRSRGSYSSKRSSGGNERSESRGSVQYPMSPPLKPTAGVSISTANTATFAGVSTPPPAAVAPIPADLPVQVSPSTFHETTPLRSSYISSKHTSVQSSYSQATASGDDDAPAPPVTIPIAITAEIDLSTPDTPVVAPPPPPLASPPLPTPISSFISPPASSTVAPDTSISTYFDSSHRVSLALSDGEVGIGLTLLQNMADGDGFGGWSDSDDEGEILGGSSRGLSADRGSGIDGQVLGRSSSLGKWRASVASEGSRYSSEDGGLGYDEDTDAGHEHLKDGEEGDVEDELEADITQTQAAFKHLDELASRRQSIITHSPSPAATLAAPLPLVAPLSPGRSRFMPPNMATTANVRAGLGLGTTLADRLGLNALSGDKLLSPARGDGYEMEFPTPPTHTPQLSLSAMHTTATMSSPTTPGTTSRPSSSSNNAHTHVTSMSSIHTHVSSSSSTNNLPDPSTFSQEHRTRKPSLAPSHTSTNASSDWEGAAAADIYDDYRYSRFSGGSKGSGGRVSISSTRTMGGGRPSTDLPGPPSYASVPPPSTPPPPSTSAPGSPPQHHPVAYVVGPPRTRSRSNTSASFNPNQMLPPPTPPPTGTPPPPPHMSPHMSPPHPLPPQIHHASTPPPLYPRPPSGASADLQRQIDLNKSLLGTSALHRKGGSSSSEASVYTQASGAIHSPRIDGGFVVGGGSVPPSPLRGGPRFAGMQGVGTSGTSSGMASGMTSSPRPAPLALVSSNTSIISMQGAYNDDDDKHHQRSPLLHTSWGSPASSPGPTTTQFASFPTSLAPNTGTNPLNTPNTSSSFGNLGSSPPLSSASANGFGTNINGGPGVSGGLGGLEALERAMHGNGGRSKSSSEDSLSGLLGGGGMASAFRQRFEVERKPSIVNLVQAQSIDEGGGRRIVVEDDEDDVSQSRVVVEGSDEDDESREGMSVEVDDSITISHGRVLQESPSLSSSPEPEPDMLSKRLAPLAVANRTPTPSGGEEVYGEFLISNRRRGLDSQPTIVSPPPAPVSLPPPSITMSPPPSTSPIILPPSTSSSPAPTHLRPKPTLNELRGLQPGQEPAQRQSLFLPHPNAPKAPPSSQHSPGPMYIQQQPPPRPTQPPRSGAVQTILLALQQAGQGLVKGRGPTIYGVTTGELSASMGPVLMHFMLTPPPARAPQAKTNPAPAPISIPGPVQASSPLAAPMPKPPVRRVGSMASLDGTVGSSDGDVRKPESGAIPRANFFPKVGTARPRSRSFSGFQSTTAEVPMPRSRDDRSSPQMPSASEIKRSLSPIIQSPTSPSMPPPQNKNAPPKPSPLRVSSPLSRPQEVPARPSFRPPNSPLGQSFSFGQNQASTSVPPSPTHATGPRPAQQLRQMSSRSTLSESPRPTAYSKSTPPTGGYTSDMSPPPKQHATSPPELRKRPSVDNDAVSVHSTRSNLASPPPALGRRESLRSKLSLPNLRRNHMETQAASNNNPPDSPSYTLPDTGDTLQVKDMDFELIRPNISHINGARTSEDSGVMGRDMSVDARQDGTYLRADTPMSPTVPRSPTLWSDTGSTSGSGMWAPAKSQGYARGGGTDSESSMDAHRHRELKWMNVISSVSPSQSRKNKKVKKLVFDGVPSSVRYLVWSHLTDGKGKSVPGVYSQLGGRGRVAALVEVERDVQRCFTDHPQLQSTRGPVLSLLQAYLSMVPDVQYMTGLTLITGQLLLLAPEEDAFWIFVSIMDTHIRPYFSSTSTLIDVDSSLFQRALEAVDAPLAKKIFFELSIPPVAICRPWFTSLFVGSLPSDYLNRVWDIFLFEGVPFLFRVALVLLACCRRQIFEAISEETAFNALLRPSPSQLPSSPEALITLALAVKLKDDDLRKQRIKLEAQVKRQTQVPRTTPGTISLPRS